VIGSLGDKQLGGSSADSRVESIPIITGTVRRCDVDNLTDGFKEGLLDLLTNQGYSATCSLASIDERSKCTAILVAPKDYDLLQLG